MRFRFVTGPPRQKDLRDYLRPVLKRWWLFVAVLPIVTIGTYFYYDGKPKAYQASSELYVKPSTLNQILLEKGGGTKDVDIQNLALLIQTRAVAREATRALAREKGGGKVAGSVAAAPVEGTSFITVTATSPTPRGAARLANAYARTFVEIQRRQLRKEAKRTLRTARKQLARLDFSAESARREVLEDKLQTLQLVAAQPSSGAGLRQAESAVPPSSPIDHDPMGHAIFAFVISLMLAIGGAYGLEYLNRRIASVEDAEEVYGLPVLTEIPKVAAPAPLERRGAAMARMFQEPFHRLQTSLDLLARERPLRTILVASAAPEEGKSIVARNLAIAYREAGRNVAVLDADLRSATLGGLLAARQGLGLSDILAGRASFGQVVQEVPTPAGPNGGGGSFRHQAGESAGPGAARAGELAMVPAGEHHGGLAAALASGAMRQTLSTAADAYGTAIVDSPPLLAVADVLPLLSEADAVVLVTRLGVSTRESARRLLGELERVPDVHVAGIVVNGISQRVYTARAYGRYYG
jgi:non-specific protein-tyrosine kinase